MAKDRKELSVTEKLIVTAAICGAEVTKEQNPAVPYTVEEIAREIGVDSLGYLSVESVRKIARGADCDFCTGCFTGDYPAEVPAEAPKDKFEQRITKTKTGA